MGESVLICLKPGDDLLQFGELNSTAFPGLEVQERESRGDEIELLCIS